MVGCAQYCANATTHFTCVSRCKWMVFYMNFDAKGLHTCTHTRAHAHDHSRWWRERKAVRHFNGQAIEPDGYLQFKPRCEAIPVIAGIGSGRKMKGKYMDLWCRTADSMRRRCGMCASACLTIPDWTDSDAEVGAWRGWDGMAW